MHFQSEYQQKSAWNLSNCIDIHIEGSKESSFKNRHAISESKKKKKRKWLQSLSDIDNHLEPG